ncbi:MAG: GNAT family N-acetyltransferase [Fibrobacter sp.]|nr:GNAT family N-acetyltransferase [Fibrobacter sp.]
MLQIYEVTKDSPWLPQVKALYESAFPANERIPMKQLLDNKIQREFFAFVDTIDGAPTFCGFSNSITQGTITNIVYFAVKPKLRCRGYGSKILKNIREKHPETRLVVDIEVEEDSKDAKELELRERRHNFYLRNGFGAVPVDYHWQGEHYRLLTAGGTVTEKEFRDFWKEVLKNIPGAKYP